MFFDYAEMDPPYEFYPIVNMTERKYALHLHSKSSNLNTKNLIITLGCAAPFIGTFLIVPRYTFTFDFYDHYFIFFLIHLYHIVNYNNLQILPKWFLGGFMTIVAGSIFASFYADTLNFNLFKQVGGILFSASSYYIVYKLANFNIKYIFKKYSRIAFWISCYGIIEEFMHLAGIHLISDYPGSFGLYRITGFSGEPYNLALALYPATLFRLSGLISSYRSLNYLNTRNIVETVIVFTAFFLTFSTTGYTGLFLGFLVISLQTGLLDVSKPKFFLVVPFFILVYLLFNFIFTTNDSFKRKIDEGLWFLQEEQSVSIKDYNKFNSSSFVLISNYRIATEGFTENPNFGVGLGNYQNLYQEKFNKLFGLDFETRYGKSNYNDANSMFLRLIAETGIWGTAIFFIFIFYFLIKRMKTNTINEFYLIVINHGIFVLFLIRLLRCGNYISDGFFFFLLMFYFSHRIYFKFAPSVK